MQELYNVVFTDDVAKQELYYKSNGNIIYDNEHIILNGKGCYIDLLTYFNCFSLKKWKQYTTITDLMICGRIEGNAVLEVYAVAKKEENILSKIDIEGSFSQAVDINNLEEDIIGIRLISNEDKLIIGNISYKGTFSKWRELDINIIICTYKREIYVQKTIDKLMKFSEQNPYLSVLVVDNGRTLQPKNTEKLTIIHNPNYGGSGGFTRGMIECLDNKKDYLLLMDDDIDIDTSVITRTHSLLCGLKDKYKDSFLSGAMLDMDRPTIQYENTAYWNRILIHHNGCELDLSKKEVLLKNNMQKYHINQYGAWWYCCIPKHRIKNIGLPLPLFIKGDDIEYGIRNNRETLFINGVGVWHEPFKKKQTYWINYFSDRNFLIINQYLNKCSRYTLFTAILGRLVKRLLKGNFKDVSMLNLAIYDLCAGFELITKFPADKKLKQIKEYKEQRNIVFIMLDILRQSINVLINYKTLKKKYIDFRDDNLMNDKFWRKYLNKSRM